MTMLRILHLNSMLKGGGTDDQCTKAATGLLALGHQVTIAGPSDREHSPPPRNAGVPLHPTPTNSKPAFILNIAKSIRRDRVQILHAHHGSDYAPAAVAARISG